MIEINCQSMVQVCCVLKRGSQWSCCSLEPTNSEKHSQRSIFETILGRF